MDVTLTEKRSLGDHLFMHHHFDSRTVVGLPADQREKDHAHRHSAVWTASHGPANHSHPVAWDDGPLLIVLQSAACKALPSDVMSAHDAVADEVLDALRTAGYLLVRA